MKLKAFAACLYIGMIYFLSAHWAGLHPLFFPTLGAFAYLFVARSATAAEMGRALFGAAVCSAIGTALSHLHPSTLFFVVNAMLAIWLIHRWKWNAPPIMGVAFLPFFSKPDSYWLTPAFATAAIAGLTLVLLAAAAVAKLKALRSFLPTQASLD
ncbi:HPP family protein [Cohnella zeiphila]|uniref:HPP family protein n=1 Tax=Cohnella zeiphila TaxID=2761120 RepID=A0A7X0VVV4_9BACL|nr:HPP family protein [Cohnella zeiphila]MBB6731767.1 HPP family protein [Cohnella zeiphila]